MTTPVPVIGNAQARAIFLQAHQLLDAPGGSGRGAGLAHLIGALGFVQMDSVNTLARAHDLILWSRRPTYRAESLRWLNDRARLSFETWTHDAALVPIQFYPYWRLKFARDTAKIEKRWPKRRGADFKRETDAVLQHIDRDGAVCSRDLKAEDAATSTGWWDWHPSKTALEYLWRAGRLAICHRRGFTKHFDLAERVIPAKRLNAFASDEETVNWACGAALDRLGFATSGELAAFWAIATPEEAKAWVARGLASGALAPVDIACTDGVARRSVVWTDAPAPPEPSASRRIRVLSPFDPALRDRARAERLFGFSYRIEIFVPAAQRRYGYYIFPVLQGQCLIGRTDIDADREAGRLILRAFWPEPGRRFGSGQQRRFMAELDRLARWQGLDGIDIADGWLRDH